MEYVSDQIGDDYKDWTAEKPIVIEAPTGAGKTHFVLNVLLPWAAQQGKRIVYLSNRTALKMQVDEDIRKMDNRLQECIKPLNYQQASWLHLGSTSRGRHNHKQSKKIQQLQSLHQWLCEADYFVLDEAHFFLADAGFNEQITQCIQYMSDLRERNASIVWIFMTATTPYFWLTLKSLFGVPIESMSPFPGFEWFYRTPDNLEDEDYPFDLLKNDPFANIDTILAYREGFWDTKDYFRLRMDEYQQYFNNAKEKCVCYSTKDKRMEQIFPVYYDSEDELIRAVLRTSPSEKWLIFADSKRAGEDLRDRLLSAGVDTAFVSAENKSRSFSHGGQAFDTIVKKKRFPNRVLIATKVLDNGVSIHDSALKHIVIDSPEKTEFLQMLGRKRFEADGHESVNLYIPNRSEGEMKRRFNLHVLPFIQFHYDFERVHNLATRDEVYPSNPIYRTFLFKYTKDGHYQRKFQPYVRLIHPSVTHENRSPLTREQQLVRTYDLISTPLPHLAYNYYTYLAMFEKYKSEREEILLARGFDGSSEEYANRKKMKDRKKAEQQLIDKQFMWLKEQLSWIGKEYDETRWITYVTGTYQEQRDKLQRFLEAHREYNGLLTIDEERELKDLFRGFMKEVKPIHPDAKSKGSLEVINRCLVEFKFPFRVESRRETRFGKQRRWWHVRPVSLAQSTEK